MRKFLSVFVVVMFLLASVSFVFALAPDMHNRHMPSFNIKLTEAGSKMPLRGEAMGSVLLTRGNKVSVILRGLEPDKFYSLHYKSDCIDLDKRTNRHGNLRSEKVEWDYSDLYEMRDVELGGDVPTIKSGVSEDFEVVEFKCSATTGKTVLMGAEPKNTVRELVP